MKLKLKVLWRKTFLGFAVNQEGSQSSYSLTPYYFWPKTDAWEQLNLELNSKPWLFQEEKIEVLNLIAEIMNYWKQNRNIQTLASLEVRFSEVEFQGIGL